MQTIKVRRATRKDIPELVKIVKGETSIEDYPGEYNKYLFEKMLKDDEIHLIVAEINKEVVGFNEFSLNKDKALYLESVAVSKKHRGKGIANLLIEWMENYAKKNRVKRITFLVREWNDSMNHLAQKRKYNLKTKLNYWEKTRL